VKYEMTLFVGDAALGVPNAPRNFGTPRAASPNTRKLKIKHKRVIAGLTRNPMILVTCQQDGIPDQVRDDGTFALACARWRRPLQFD